MCINHFGPALQHVPQLLLRHPSFRTCRSIRHGHSGNDTRPALASAWHPSMDWQRIESDMVSKHGLATCGERDLVRDTVGGDVTTDYHVLAGCIGPIVGAAQPRTSGMDSRSVHHAPTTAVDAAFGDDSGAGACRPCGSASRQPVGASSWPCARQAGSIRSAMGVSVGDVKACDRVCCILSSPGSAASGAARRSSLRLPELRKGFRSVPIVHFHSSKYGR